MWRVEDMLTSLGAAGRALELFAARHGVIDRLPGQAGFPGHRDAGVLAVSARRYPRGDLGGRFLGGRGHRGPGVVAGGEVRAHGGDHHVGAADGPGGKGGVEDVLADEDLGLAGGRVVWCGPVYGPDLMAA